MSQSELLLLGLIEQHSMHGYEMFEFIDKRLGARSDLTKPTAYRLLEHLHAKGYVSRHAEREGKRPERLVYELTENGRMHLVGLLREQLADSPNVVYPGNIALLFASILSAGDRLELIERRRSAAADRVAQSTAARDHHQPGSAAYLVLDHDLALQSAELQWLDASMEAVARLTDERDSSLCPIVERGAATVTA